MQVTNGTRAYQTWKDFYDVNIKFQLYFFNVTNSDDIVKFGAKPNLNEIGPFTYSLNQNKTNIIYHSNGTVSFKEVKTWTFMRNLSVADETLQIVTINAPLAITLAIIEKSPHFLNLLIDEILEDLSEGYFIKRSIKELTFDGYPDKIMKYAPLFMPDAYRYNGRFGYFYGKNHTDDGHFNVFTGENSIHQLNYIENYNGLSHLNNWLSKACNSLNESIRGALGPPLLQIPEYIKIFSPDICRTLKLRLHGSHKKINGLITWRYALDESNFQNFVDNPFNSGYGTSLAPLKLTNLTHSLGPSIYPSGVFDISRCQYNTPLFVSQPHFLNADPYYLSTLNGLKPNRSIHEFWIEKEPSSGASAWGECKIQLNFAIYKPSRYGKYKNIPNIILPVFWQNYSFKAEPELINVFKLINRIYYIIPQIVLYAIIFITTIYVIYSITQIRSPQENTETRSTITNKFIYCFTLCCHKTKVNS